MAKFWSNKDEKLDERADDITSLAEKINSAGTAEELRQLIEQLSSLGVDVSDLPKFAKGGSFITSGPQAIMVGDNLRGENSLKLLR